MKPIFNHKLSSVKPQSDLNPIQGQPPISLSAFMRYVLVFTVLLGASLLPAGAQPAAAQTLPLVGTSLATGNNHVCVVTSSGGVKCWGNNSLYQLNGDTGLTTGPRATPVDVDLSGDTAVSVAAGVDGSCALVSTGDVKCWGRYNGSGGPVTTILGLSGGAVAIAEGAYHACALMNTGGAKCWGASNTVGERGDGTFAAVPTIAAGYTANDVLGVSNAVAIDAGLGLYSHTCVITSVGGMKCWGGNTRGELGDGTTTNRNVAVSVAGLGGTVVALSVGRTSTCAVLSSGGVQCWGSIPAVSGANGTAPGNVAGLSSGVVSVEIGSDSGSGNSGDDYLCALMTSGKVKCLGNDQSAVLGNPMGIGYSGGAATPTDVVGLDSPVVAMSSGENFMCMLLSTGEVKCVGGSLYGVAFYGSYAYTNSQTGLSTGGGVAIYRPLSISKSAPSPYPPVAGQPVAYTIQVTNSNTSALTNVTVTDLPAPSLSMTGFSSSPAGTCSTTTRKCTLTSALAAGASASFNVTFTTSSSVGAIITNTAYVTASQSAMWTYPTAPMLVLQSATASAGGGTASLKVTKSASVAQATTGTPFDYTITVTNTGATAATNVKATDKLPAGVTFNSASILSGTGSCSQAAGVVTCIWGSVGAGASVSAKITVTP